MEGVRVNERYTNKFVGIHVRAVMRSVRELQNMNEIDPEKNSLIKSVLKTLVYHCIAYMNQIDRQSNKAQARNATLFAKLTFESLMFLSPNELMQMFPVQKQYDGEKCKKTDYYSTMKVLTEYGLDKPMGSNVMELLWEYNNRKVRNYLISWMDVLGDWCECSGDDLMIEALKGLGIPVKEKCTDQKGSKYTLDSSRNLAEHKNLRCVH